jgi:hypothetical protein
MSPKAIALNRTDIIMTSSMATDFNTTIEPRRRVAGTHARVPPFLDIPIDRGHGI